MKGRETGVVRLWNACPCSDHVTAYDMANIHIYNWLLNAENEGMSESEMARMVFGLDAMRRPERSAIVVRTHLSRAHWMQDNEFPYLNW